MDKIKRDVRIAYVIAPGSMLLVALTSHLVPGVVQLLYLIGYAFAWGFFGAAVRSDRLADEIAEEFDNQ